MMNARMRLGVTFFLLSGMGVPVLAQVFSSEFFADPVSEGWEQVLHGCDPETWNEDGWYRQQLDLDACPPGPGGGADVYRRSLEPLNGTPKYFAEFRVQTDGERSEIPGGAPTLVALANDAVLYHITVARDLVKFLRDVDLPILFIEIEPDAPHTYRLELSAERYAFYIDADLIDEGVSEGPFPADNPRISWRGRSWYLPCHNAWDYIRVGVTPDDAGGDYDTSNSVDLFDFYFFHECLTNDRVGINGGPDNDAGPGCRWADFDSDSDVDLSDFAYFQSNFAAAE